MSESIDQKHFEYMKTYNSNNIRIQKLVKKNMQLKEIFNKSTNIDKRMSYLDEYKLNKLYIKKLKDDKKQYYIKNSKEIFEYFENKKNIQNNLNKKILVNNFFEKKKPISTNDITDINNFKNNYLNTNKLFIYQDDICSICNRGELIEHMSEGIKICNNCGNSVKYIVEHVKPSYKDPPKDVSFYAYKRINHFREILAQFQAKESTTIPDKIISDIKKQIEKERISYSELTNSKTKEVLKKLGYNKFYEHISFIKEKLGIKPPIMSSDLEETLCNLFIEIQIPYAKYCPKDRVNFLNYYYTIYKLCEMLNYKEFLPYFPMLKDREKIVEQDMIWKKICKELNWNYIYTV